MGMDRNVEFHCWGRGVSKNASMKIFFRTILNEKQKLENIIHEYQEVKINIIKITIPSVIFFAKNEKKYKRIKMIM